MARGGEYSQTPVDEEGLWVPKAPAPPQENASPPPWSPCSDRGDAQEPPSAQQVWGEGSVFALGLA